MHSRPWVLVAALSLLVAACDDAPAEAKKSSKPAEASKPAGAKGPAASEKPAAADVKGPAASEKPAAEAKAPPAAPKRVEVDLSPAGPSWEGWAIETVEGATVTKEGEAGARVTVEGAQGFALVLMPGHEDLAALETSLLAGKGIPKDTSKAKIQGKDEAKLSWRVIGFGVEREGFAQHLSVDGTEVTCRSAPASELPIGGAVALRQAECETLKKS